MSDPLVKKRPTAADVGREAGVSRATVGFVFNQTAGQTISSSTRARVLEAAERIGYRPHAGAQALARGASRIVLLVLPDWPVGASMQRLIEAASSVLDDAGYTLVTYTPRRESAVRPLWELLEPEVVMGFAPFTPEQLVSMRAQGINHIFPDDIGGSASPDTGPAEQLRFLHGLGHRRIAYASTADPRLTDLASVRVQAAQQHEQRHDRVPLDVRTLAGQDDAIEAVRDWRAAGVTAVAAYNDDVAALIVGAALRLGLSVPNDLSVIGHDDAPIAALFVPSLTTVRRNEEADGANFAAVAIAQASGTELPDLSEAVLEQVIVRDSCAAIPASDQLVR
ncbi:LacI family DNA-binding transcriptional regulator [Plantibacter sp. MPB07]|uniref:LacI family DNA-binding transcriptional regulator n=1 Tax=Plantibacter sp. MPB07 TaxID=3388853 RepID=UPI003987884A